MSDDEPSVEQGETMVRVRVVTSVCAVLALAAGCGSAGRATSISSDPTSASASAGASADPATAATSAARRTLRAYLDLTDRLARNPKLPLSGLDAVASGGVLSGDQTSFNNRRVLKWHTSGAGSQTIRRAIAVRLDDRPPSVVFDVCIDTRHVRVTDGSGKPVPTSPVKRFVNRVTVSNPGYASDPADGWRVSRIVTKGRC